MDSRLSEALMQFLGVANMLVAGSSHSGGYLPTLICVSQLCRNVMQGTEDSRLSEALMQFLGAANALVAGSSHSGGRQDGLQARTFGVIPVGAQAGLIEWVQDSKPIYSIWQAWHQRRAQRSGASEPSGGLLTVPKAHTKEKHIQKK